MKTSSTEDVIKYLRDNIQDDNHLFIIDIRHKGRYKIEFWDWIHMELFDDVYFIEIYRWTTKFIIPRSIPVLNETIIALDINFWL